MTPSGRDVSATSSSVASWHQVGRTMLGRWPAQVAAWGEEGIAAYVDELQADGLTPDDALTGLRSYRPEPGRDFPPSVAAVSQLAQRDPSQPTFDEALTLWRTALRAHNLPVTGDFTTEAQMLRARCQHVLDRAESMHPRVSSFVARHGVARLLDEVGELDGPYGAVRRNELEAAWVAHLEACDERGVAALVAPRRGGGLAQLDPLASLGVDRDRKAIGAESEAR